MFENTSIVIMYGVTPCHAGSGSALGVVDLPIQRERHTNWPMIQASGVKGAFRANFDAFKNNVSDKSQINEIEKLTESIFGSENTSNGFAGSLSVSDARVLAYPMRSNEAPFVWITCPAVLKRLNRDLQIAGKIDKQIDFSEIDNYFIGTESQNMALTVFGNTKGKVLLEDYEVLTKPDEILEDLAPLTEYIKSAEKLLLVSDNVFNYGVSECTQIIAQIKINQKTGTTADGSLHYQEELPSDTIMYSVLHWGDSRNKAEDKLKAETIKSFVTKEVIANHIQVGGDETLGRGVFMLDWK